MGIEMHPYLSPTGAGMTSNKGLAERMEQLRLEYIEACEKSNYAHKGRIQSEEKSLAILINNERMNEEREAERLKTASASRFIRVTEYFWKEKAQSVETYDVYLDIDEIEALRVEASGPRVFRILMKSGRHFDVNEDAFNLLEKTMRERE
jgi:hypothetical protein